MAKVFQSQIKDMNFKETYEHTAVSILFYVLIGFQLYDRIEELIDKVTRTHPNGKGGKKKK